MGVASSSPVEGWVGDKVFQPLSSSLQILARCAILELAGFLLVPIPDPRQRGSSATAASEVALGIRQGSEVSFALFWGTVLRSPTSLTASIIATNSGF